jgi:hypothetical protein
MPSAALLEREADGKDPVVVVAVELIRCDLEATDLRPDLLHHAVLQGVIPDPVPPIGKLVIRGNMHAEGSLRILFFEARRGSRNRGNPVRLLALRLVHPLKPVREI